MLAGDVTPTNDRVTDTHICKGLGETGYQQHHGHQSKILRCQDSCQNGQLNELQCRDEDGHGSGRCNAGSCGGLQRQIIRPYKCCGIALRLVPLSVSWLYPVTAVRVDVVQIRPDPSYLHEFINCLCTAFIGAVIVNDDKATGYNVIV